ncbi:hypothetical protein C1Y40_00880 [Mycobacterium talmoniae]|uniref:Uncharacterized protein n=1 Tax=Mycobacterium talmoniae TaxID=1858794 RepID=A0A2S8BQK8_9MYCO|nr:hypothetical protein C1Y40_00880 [Mycobacterium talmoniae]
MPASLTTSTVAPASMAATSDRHPPGLIGVEQADQLSGDADLQRDARVRTRRVSSAATTSAEPSAATSRGDASEG